MMSTKCAACKYARCIRRDIVEYLDQLQIVAWDDRDDTDDRILSTDKIWSSYLMDGHSGQLLRMVMRKNVKHVICFI